MNIAPRGGSSILGLGKDKSNLGTAIRELENSTVTGRSADPTLLYDFDSADKSDSLLLAELRNYQNKISEFNQNYLTRNQYVPKAVRSVYTDKMNDATSLSSIDKVQSDVKREVKDAEYLIKTLSAIGSGVSKSNLDSSTKKSLLSETKSIGSAFHKTGKINNYQIKALMSAAKSFKDGEGNSLVDIDSESNVTEAVSSRVQSNLTSSAQDRVSGAVDSFTSSSTKEDYTKDEKVNSYKKGETSTNELLEYFKSKGEDTGKLELALATALGKDAAISSVFKDELSVLSDTLVGSNVTELALLREQYSEGNVTLEDLTQRLESLLGSSDESNVAIARMSNHLSSIEDNTEQGKLSNADKILSQNQRESEQENSDKLSELLGGISTTKGARSSVLGGSEDAEDLGADAVNSIFDKVGGDVTREDSGDRKRRKSKGKSKGKFGALKSLVAKGGSSALKLAKGAGPLAAVASLGMGAYDYSQADSSEERKDAVGSTTGSTVGAIAGGILGSFLGPVGTVAGAALGTYLGGKVGSWASTLFTSPQDMIPDEITSAGPAAQLSYIDKELMPSMVRSIAMGEDKFDEDDLKELSEYRDSQYKVLTQSTDKEKMAILNLTNQGLNDPMMIAAATGISLSKVNQSLGNREPNGQGRKPETNTVTYNTKKDGSTSTIAPVTNNTTNVTNNTTNGSEQGGNDFSIKDMRFMSLM